MLSDVAGRRGAEHRIDHSVQAHIGIAMAGKATLVLDAHAAKPQFLAFCQPVDVQARADSRSEGSVHEILRESELA